jgi:hypothetical protein
MAFRITLLVLSVGCAVGLAVWRFSPAPSPSRVKQPHEIFVDLRRPPNSVDETAEAQPQHGPSQPPEPEPSLPLVSSSLAELTAEERALLESGLKPDYWRKLPPEQREVALAQMLRALQIPGAGLRTDAP